MPHNVHPETLKAAWSRSREGFAEVAPDGHLKNVNKTFAAIVGYAPSELQEKKFQDITHPDDVMYDKEMVDQVMAGKVESYPMTKRYITKDNGVVWVRLQVSAIEIDGERRLLLGQIMVLEREKGSILPEVVAPDPITILSKHWKKLAVAGGGLITGLSSLVYYIQQQARMLENQSEQIEQLKTLLEALVK